MISIGRGTNYSFEGVEFEVVNDTHPVIHVTWVMEGTFGEKTLTDDVRRQLIALLQSVD